MNSLLQNTADHFLKLSSFDGRASSNETLSYSSFVRMLTKQYDDETVEKFQKLFKEYFDRFYLHGHPEPEQEALDKAIRHMKSFKKQANSIEMGDSEFAGKRLSELIKFLLRRIPDGKRDKAVQSIKRKIFMLNENDIAQKETPPSSSIGQSIGIIKTILLEHNPQYIRQVINAIVRNL